MSDGYSKLPKELGIPTTNGSSESSNNQGITEDFRRMLEEIIEQNATILERLDDCDDDDEDEDEYESKVLTTTYQKPTIVQVFETVFSWETVIILIVLALLVIPLFRTALD